MNPSEKFAGGNPGSLVAPDGSPPSDHAAERPDCVPTGIASLDGELGGGVMSGSLTVLCAMTGYGKSTKIAHVAQVAAHFGHPVQIHYITDLTKKEYYQRLTAWESDGEHYSRIRPYPAEHFPLIELNEIDHGDTGFMNRMAAAVETFKKLHNKCPVVVFDGLDAGNPDRQILDSRVQSFAILAKQTGAVVWATTQANEKADKNRTVTLDCVRESKGKAFPASLFIGLGHTPEDKNLGIVTLTIDKNRSGRTFQVRAGVDWAHQRFFDLDDTFELASAEAAEEPRQIETARVKSA